MDEKTKLLEQLRIDRGEGVSSAPVSRRSVPIWVVYLLLLVIVAGIGSGFFLRSHGATSVAAGATTAADSGAAAASVPAGATALDASGYVVAQRQATVSAKTTGRVVELRIEDGQRVREGEIIARLDDTNTQAGLFAAKAQLAQAEASLDAAKVAVADAGPIYDRNQKQRAAGVISAQDFDADKSNFNAVQSDLLVKQRMVDVAQANVEVAQRNEDDMTVRAPYDGVITVKAAQQGEIVSPISAGGGFTRTGIGTIVDMNSLEVEVDVSENFINRVHVNQPVTVRLNAYPDWNIPGAVIAIIPTADRSKATVMVRVGFKEKDARILPEMGARVSFMNDSSPHT
ncbi:MAG: efflux RND transporter periplasmic adaptor subunit [Steroidobacteraceae bacterium]